MVENALYASSPEILEAAAVPVPDERLSELVGAVVSLKPSYRSKVSEDKLLQAVAKR